MLMLKQQPVASDLRHISTALKVVTDLERMGDQAADIADLSLRLEDADISLVSKHLPGHGGKCENDGKGCDSRVY